MPKLLYVKDNQVRESIKEQISGIKSFISDTICPETLIIVEDRPSVLFEDTGIMHIPSDIDTVRHVIDVFKAFLQDLVNYGDTDLASVSLYNKIRCMISEEK